MAKNIIEQIDEAYSLWSIMDKAGKEMHLENMWQQMSVAYQYLFQVYRNRGYLTSDETDYANKIRQMLLSLQNEKMKVDQDLANEMLKHIVKMKERCQ